MGSHWRNSKRGRRPSSSDQFQLAPERQRWCLSVFSVRCLFFISSTQLFMLSTDPGLAGSRVVLRLSSRVLPGPGILSSAGFSFALVLFKVQAASSPSHQTLQACVLFKAPPRFQFAAKVENHQAQKRHRREEDFWEADGEPWQFPRSPAHPPYLSLEMVALILPGGFLLSSGSFLTCVSSVVTVTTKSLDLNGEGRIVGTDLDH